MQAKMKVSTRDVMKILESDLLIDQGYPEDSILQKCFVWYALQDYSDYLGISWTFLAKKAKHRNWSGTKGLDWTPWSLVCI